MSKMQNNENLENCNNTKHNTSHKNKLTQANKSSKNQLTDITIKIFGFERK